VLGKLMKRYPDNWKLRRMLGEYYFEVFSKYGDNWDKPKDEIMKLGKKHLLDARKHNVADSKSLFKLGTFYLEEKQYDEAISYLSESVKLNKTYPTSNYNLAYAYSDDSGHSFRPDSGQLFRRNPATLGDSLTLGGATMS